MKIEQSRERRKQAYQDYVLGMTIKDISDKYDVSIETVKSWRKRGKWVKNKCNLGYALHKLQSKLQKVGNNIEINLRANYINVDGKERSLQEYYSERIKASEQVRIDINFEQDPLRMLDKSLLCIYLLTGDEVFYNHNRDKLIRFIAEYKY